MSGCRCRPLPQLRRCRASTVIPTPLLCHSRVRFALPVFHQSWRSALAHPPAQNALGYKSPGIHATGYTSSIIRHRQAQMVGVIGQSHFNFRCVGVPDGVVSASCVIRKTARRPAFWRILHLQNWSADFSLRNSTGLKSALQQFPVSL